MHTQARRYDKPAHRLCVHIPLYFRNNIYIVKEKSWRAAELQSLFVVLKELCKKFKGGLDFNQAIWTRVSNLVDITATTKYSGCQQHFPLGETVK